MKRMLNWASYHGVLNCCWLFLLLWFTDMMVAISKSYVNSQVLTHVHLQLEPVYEVVLANRTKKAIEDSQAVEESRAIEDSQAQALDLTRMIDGSNASSHRTCMPIFQC